MEDHRHLTVDECEIDGHSFEGYDTISEICAVCGLIREYATRASNRRRSLTLSDEIHTCTSAADHAFGAIGIRIRSWCRHHPASMSPA